VVLLLGGIFDRVEQIRESAMPRAVAASELHRIIVEPRSDRRRCVF
jgi:hypothetical protein